MSGFPELRRRARDRAGAAARTYLACVTDRLCTGPLHVIFGLFHIYVGDRVCLRCRATTSHVTNRVYRDYRETGVLRCGCGGRLLPAYERRLIGLLTGADEEQLARLLALTSNTVYPDEKAGLQRIRARTSGAPVPGGAATGDDDLGSQTS